MEEHSYDSWNVCNYGLSIVKFVFGWFEWDISRWAHVRPQTISKYHKVESIYWWIGKVEEAEETAMIAKTTESKIKEVVDAIKSMHSYEVPAIIAIPIFDGSESYIKYVEECK